MIYIIILLLLLGWWQAYMNGRLSKLISGASIILAVILFIIGLVIGKIEINIIAYVLALFLSPTVAGLLHIVILPIHIFAVKKGVSRFIVSLTVGLISGIITVWFGTIILNWFSLQPTVWLLVILGCGIMMNGIHRIKTRPDTDSEIGYLIGDILGVIFIGLLLVWNFGINQLTIPFIITIGIIGYIGYTMTKSGNLSFWHLTRKYPGLAYDFFTNDDSWYVLDEIKNTSPPPNKEEWSGPFRVFVPELNKMIKVYGRTDSYIESQEKFKDYINNMETEMTNAINDEFSKK